MTQHCDSTIDNIISQRYVFQDLHLLYPSIRSKFCFPDLVSRSSYDFRGLKDNLVSHEFSRSSFGQVGTRSSASEITKIESAIARVRHVSGHMFQCSTVHAASRAFCQTWNALYVRSVSQVSTASFLSCTCFQGIRILALTIIRTLSEPEHFSTGSLYDIFEGFIKNVQD